MNMTEHLPILRRVGWLLVIVGTLDIGVMIYCIVNKVSYSSSLNVFALAAGIFLLRGHLGAVRYVTWFSAFLLSGMLLCFLTVFPWLQPMDYWLLVISNHPFGSVAYLVLVVVFFWMLFWVYTQMRLPAVVEARVAAGQTQGAPTSAFVAGTALAIILGVMLQLTMKGAEAQEAKRLAAEQYGHDYKYFVSSINWSDNHVSARLTAYKEDEIKEVEVEWNR